MKYVKVLLVVLPIAEIAVLLLSGRLIGFWGTLSVILLTGLAGAYLAKRQGMETLRRARSQMGFGGLPGKEAFEGVCIAAGGILLILPGFISDLFGIMLLLPPVRNMIRPWILSLMTKRLYKRRIKIIR